MESEQRPHNRSSTSTGGELFICFTSRLSSSSMKISSKSILSPGRTREPSQISLSTSLSRRLRSNGSMKGGQASPMFPTAGKKKGCAFENPEPSSPKVTCIGQVRVKTKKQGKKMRSRSKRKGEVSFRRVEQGLAAATATTTSDGVVGQISRSYSQSHFNQEQRNQRWVHLPMTICEALRAFGADFNCFLPCRSSCMSTGEKAEKTAGSGAAEGGGSNTSTSCGAVFARWLVSLQEGDGKGREIELVVGEEEEKPVVQNRSRSQRRHVFEDIDIEEEKISKVVEEEEEARVSVCVPPKNALLLMRCRSDPVKMAALANRFWESPLRKEPEEQEEEEEDGGNEEYHEAQEAEDETKKSIVQETEHSRNEDNEEEKRVLVMEEEDQTVEDEQETEIPEQKLNDLFAEEAEAEAEAEEQQNPEPETEVNAAIEECNVENQDTEVVTEEPSLPEAATVSTDSSLHEVLVDREEQEIEDFAANSEEEAEDGDVEENRASVPTSPLAFVHSQPEAESDSESNSEQDEDERDDDQEETESETETVAEAHALSEMAVSAKTEDQPRVEEEEGEGEETATSVRPKLEDPNPPPMTHEYEPARKSKERGSGQNQKRLPDCLLLMMCEPKLSMEVSKETWVCSTDFIRWLPERPPVKGAEVAKTDVPDEPKKRISIDSNPAQKHQNKHPRPLLQPPRSSCSFPAQPPASSMASMIEQKLDKAKAYEPFVLTRCKSEPMRSASKLAPDACCWNNRKLEPHRPGIGATGVGC